MRTLLKTLKNFEFLFEKKQETMVIFDQKIKKSGFSSCFWTRKIKKREKKTKKCVLEAGFDKKVDFSKKVKKVAKSPKFGVFWNLKKSKK